MNLKFLIFILIAIILEGVVSYPFTLLSISIASVYLEGEVMLVAFVAGILLDLFTLRTLGVDSLYFLTLLFLGIRYKKKIYEGSVVYKFFYLLVSFVIYSLLFYRKLDLVSLLVTVILTVSALFVFEKIFPSVGSKKRLAV